MLIMIVIYVTSVYGTYKFCQTSYSKNGQWSSINPDLLDLFMTLMPVINTILSFMYLLGFCYEKGHIKRKEIDLSKFYKVIK
jgi:hypothetical protein